MLILILYFQKQVQKRNRITRRECLDLAEDRPWQRVCKRQLWRNHSALTTLDPFDLISFINWRLRIPQLSKDRIKVALKIVVYIDF
jgi:hypothetical protein